jgi:hypothetical protein
MAHARNRRQNESNPETFGDNQNTESASPTRKSRHVAATRGNVIVTGSAVGQERSLKLGSRGHSQVPSTSNSSPTPTSTVTITNPIWRETPSSFKYTGSGRRNQFGVASTEWNEQDEMKPHSNSRRRLYPPLVNEQKTATSSSPNLYAYERRTEPGFTTVFERPPSRAEHRPRVTLAIDPPPEVLRLDSTGTGDNDNGLEFGIQNTGDDSGLVRICFVLF